MTSAYIAGLSLIFGTIGVVINAGATLCGILCGLFGFLFILYFGKER